VSGHAFAILIGFVGSILTISMAVPQAVKVWRDRSGTGVSLPTWTLMLFVYALWLGYALRVGDVASYTANILSLATQIALIAGLLVYQPPAHRSLFSAGTLAASLAFGVIGYFAPMPVLWTFMAVGMVVRLPQALKSIRTWRNHGASEVSVSTWVIGLIAGTCWMLHGIFMPDPTFTITNIAVIILSLTVIVFEGLNNARPDHPSVARAY